MRLLLILTCVLFFKLIVGQQNTFFAKDQTGFSNDGKIYIEPRLVHELPETGYLIGYNTYYRGGWLLRYATYDIRAKHVKNYSPIFGYSDPQIEWSALLNEQDVFICGDGEHANLGQKEFSYYYDKKGSRKWQYVDSLNIRRLYFETDTNNLGWLSVHKNISDYNKGDYLVRLDSNGIIYWSQPFSTIFNQLKTDTANEYNWPRELYKTEKGFVLVLSRASLGSNLFVLLNEEFSVIRELHAGPTDFQGFNSKGFLISYTKKDLYNKYFVRFYDWSFKQKWEYHADSSVYNYVLREGIKPLGSNFALVSAHKDSTKKWVDEYLEIYNGLRKKIRECRYSLEPGFRMTIINSTYDNGAIFMATAPTWDDFEGRFVKTDSLGLVYNTDIICDCKDFKTEDTTGTRQYLLPELHAQVFPNPATDKINVLLSHQQKATITLRNLNGQIVQTQQAELNSNIVDISTLEAGVYIVEVSSANESILKKLVVE